jgi:hypothetical protein
MQFITPLYFLLSIFLVGVIIFYLFRKQYENQIIPSTLLWQQVMREWQATKWWKKLQNHLLLYLQLLILFLLLLALTRPFWGHHELSGEHIVVVLDTSASMTAEEENDTRLDIAKNEIMNLIDQLDNQALTVILAENVPSILLSNESSKQIMESKVTDVSSSYQHADVRKAIQLANQLLAANTGEIYVYSDQIKKSDLQNINLKHDVTVQNVGVTTQNISLHTFGVSEIDGKINGLLTLYNEFEDEQLVRITIESDGKAIQEIQEIIQPGKVTQLSLTDLPSKSYYKARVTTVDDYAADNTAIAFLARNLEPTIYVTGEINPFVTKALQYVTSNLVQIENYQEKTEENSIFIVEKMPDSEWPNGPMLILAPTPGGPFQVGKKEVLKTSPQVIKEDPILHYVDMDEVYIHESTAYESGQLNTILENEEMPLISKGQYQGNPVVLLGFDIADTDWPLHASFPIFLYNVMNYLLESQATIGYFEPMELVEFSHSSESIESTIVTENGKNVKSLSLDDTVFSAPRFPGLYRIQDKRKEGITEKVFAVSIDQQEKFIHPSKSFTITSSQDSNSNNQENPNEIWPWLAFVALLLLLLEWEVYRRGISN